MRRILRDTRGATAVEYGFIAALIVLVMLVGLIALAGTVTTSYNDTASKIDNAIP